MKPMRAAIFLLALACCLARADVKLPQVVFTSAINVSVIASRTSGVAPLAVFFDASATTSGGVTSLCFHECEFRWDFGDAIASAASACGSQVAGEGFWACGAGLGANSKNLARGPVAAHVFESAGTYSVCPTITDGTNTITFGGAGNPPCITITVSDPNTVYSGTNTICLANGAAPVQNVGGCPAGASTAGSVTTLSAALAYLPTNKRVLLKRGDSFSVSSNVAVTAAGPWTVGAFGSGAKPIIQQTAAGTQLFSINAGASDGRWMDLTLDGAADTTATGMVGGGASAAQMTFLRVDQRNGAWGYTFDPVGGTRVFDQFAFVDGSHTSLTNGYCFYGTGTRFALLGNLFDHCTGFHGIRIPDKMTRSVLSANTFSSNVGNNLKINGSSDGITWSEQIIVSDNKFGGAGSSNLWLAPQNSSASERLRNVIVERNWFTSTTSGTVAAVFNEAQDTTIRNNLIDFTGAADLGGISLQGSNDDPNLRANRVKVYNNSIFSNSTTAFPGDAAIIVGGTTNNITVQNNLVYAPNANSPVAVQGTGGGVSTINHNSTDPQAKSTSPSFTTTPPTLPSHFKPACTIAYPCAQGTPVPVWSDFFLATEPGTRDIGAGNH